MLKVFLLFTYRQHSGVTLKTEMSFKCPLQTNEQIQSGIVKKKSFIFLNLSLPSTTAQSLVHGALKQISCPLILMLINTGCKMFSLENLALVESFAYMFEFTLPCKVFLHHGLALLAVHVQLAPSV